MAKKILKYTIILFTLTAIVIGGYFYWLHEKIYPSTDDAYIQANVVDIASQINGKVDTILVKNQQYVKKHQLLFTIDPKPFEIAVTKAKANLTSTQQVLNANNSAVLAAQAVLKQRQAELINAQKNYDRVIALVNKGFASKAAGDNATQQLEVAKQTMNAANNQLKEAIAKRGKPGDANADIQAAKAAIAQAKLNLKYTKVYAPESGHLAKFTLQPGQTVVSYQSLFSLVEDKFWWAMANMKETNIDRIRPGQKAIIHVDMYPDHPFRGVVASISPGSGASFSLLPPENATGNWVKVTQRFPVKVNITHLNPKYPLRLGASCTVSIDTQSHISDKPQRIS